MLLDANQKGADCERQPYSLSCHQVRATQYSIENQHLPVLLYLPSLRCWGSTAFLRVSMALFLIASAV